MDDFDGWDYSEESLTSSSEEEHARSGVLTPREEEHYLAGDADLRKALAANPHLSEQALLRLAGDASYEVQRALSSRELPVTVQEKLVRSGFPMIRAAMAANQWLAVELQHYLLDRGQLETSWGLANNSKETSVHERISFGLDTFARDTLAHNPDLTASAGISASFLSEYRPDLLKAAALAAGGDPEQTRNLAPDWNGTLDELLEVSRLVKA